MTALVPAGSGKCRRKPRSCRKNLSSPSHHSKNFYELIMRANSLPYGLAGYAFTCSLATATRASEALEVGMGGVNDLLLATAEMPFGGVRSPGTGREGGRARYL